MSAAMGIWWTQYTRVYRRSFVVLRYMAADVITELLIRILKSKAGVRSQKHKFVQFFSVTMGQIQGINDWSCSVESLLAGYYCFALVRNHASQPQNVNATYNI